MNTFTVKGSKDVHTIDQGGNHFINAKCVNPTADQVKYEGRKIGDTIPPLEDRIPIPSPIVKKAKA